ncbi:MAG: cardiolipin synthase, partial [Xanthomonadales bacterium]|nr:cardiolipin synthase [Xanthomonadales bacterium]
GLGRRMQQAMIECARSGVRVYVLYDAVGSAGLPAAYFETLREANIEVSSFNSTQGAKNSFQINFRNHRKIVVVDGHSGWLGGLNVGDEYLGLDPDFTPYRDTHLRLDGPVVIQLQGVFTQDWYWATRQLPELNWQPRSVPNSDVAALIVPSAPTQQLETAGLLFVTALNSAKERFWITAPYFVPDEAVMKALQLAALRGVDVRIIVPGKGDNQLVFLAGYYYIRQLRGLGIRFYEYAPGFLHEKVGLVDDSTSWVGTANFDNRSFRLNFEVTALIEDADFAAQMQTMFEADFAHSTPLVPEELDQRSFWWRLSVSVARLASPVL